MQVPLGFIRIPPPMQLGTPPFMNTQQIVRAYSRQSSVYDFLFEPFYGPGQRRALQTMDLGPGPRILEVGAGTGLSLRHYPKGVHLTGIDLSEKMLAHARRRAAALEIDADFQIMDAQATTFPTGNFDQVVAMHLVSVVPEPSRLITEMRRVCRPGGRLILVNYLGPNTRTFRILRKVLAPLQRLLGFKPLFGRDEFLRASEGLLWKALNGREFGFVVLYATNT